MSTASADVHLRVRLSRDLKQVIEQAAAQLGQTVGDFAVSTLVRTAREVIQQHDRTELSLRDRDTFVAALEDLECEPNAALRAAAEDYKRQMT